MPAIRAIIVVQRAPIIRRRGGSDAESRGLLGALIRGDAAALAGLVAGIAVAALATVVAAAVVSAT